MDSVKDANHITKGIPNTFSDTLYHRTALYVQYTVKPQVGELKRQYTETWKIYKV